MSSRLVNWGISITGGSTIIINSTQPSTFTNITAANIVGTSISGSSLLVSNITTTSLNMSSNVISNVANPVSLTDVANKLYIDKLQFTRGTTSNILDSGLVTNNNWTKGNSAVSNLLSFTSGYIQLSNPTGGSPNFFTTSTWLNRGTYGRNQLIKFDSIGITGVPQIHTRYNNPNDIYVTFFDSGGLKISTWNGTTFTDLATTSYNYNAGFTYTFCVKSYENLIYNHLIYNNKVIAALHSVTSGFNTRTYTANGIGNSGGVQLYDNIESRDINTLTNFVMFGDSNTFGFGITGGDEWSNQIMYDLRDQNVTVFNAGIGGDTTQLLINRISTAVYAHSVNYARNICVVLIGTNDVSTGVSLATIQANIITIVSGLLSNNFEVWLCTYPARTDNVTYNITIRTLNDWIRANTAGASRIIDLYTAFTNPANDDAILSGYMQGDGLHFSTTGATIIKNILVANLYDDDTFVKKTGTNNLNTTNITTSNLLANSRLSIGGTQPSFNSNTLGSLFITGSAALSNGTGIVINNTADIYPVYQNLAAGHNGFYQYYDCYYDGNNLRQSSNVPSFFHAKESGQLNWWYNGVSSAGNIATNNLCMTIGSSGNLGLFNNAPQVALDFGNNAFNKTLALFNNGITFFGFGANNAALQYQVDTGASHVFYVNSTIGQSAAALGTEVARINAAGISAANIRLTSGSIGSLSTGNISVSGNMTVGGNLLVQGSLISVNITSVNVIDTNISAGTLNATLASIGNLITTNISSGTIRASTNIIVPGLGAGSSGSVYLNDNNKGIQYSGTNNYTSYFSTNYPTDGIAVFGFNDGTLGTRNGGNRCVLNWNNVGNVGINTTNPAYTLDVSGTGKFTGAIFNQAGPGGIKISPTVTNGEASIAYYTGTTESGNSWVQGHNTATGGTNSFALYCGSLGTNVIYTNSRGNTLFANGFPTSGGSGTLNTLTYSAKLTACAGSNGLPATTGTVGNAIAFRVRGSDDACLDMGNNSASGSWLQSTNFISGYNTNYPLLLNPNGGNVGVGTTSPESALHIVGTRASAPSTKGIHMGEGGTNDYAIEICAATATSNSYIDFTSPGVDFKGRILYNLTNNSMNFHTNTTQFMTLSSNGNLDITGNVSISGTQLNMGNGTNNTIVFTSSGATGPTQTVNGGVGCKLSLWPGSIGASVPYGIGVESLNVWYASGGGGHKWYNVSTSAVMQLTAANLIVTGDITAFGSISDKTLKTNIAPVSLGLTTTLALNPVTFNWKDDIFNIEKRGLSDVGFIAQEVEQLIPQAVGQFTTPDGEHVYKNLKHERILPYTVSAIQELHSLIENQQTVIDSLLQRLANFEKLYQTGLPPA